MTRGVVASGYAVSAVQVAGSVGSYWIPTHFARGELAGPGPVVSTKGGKEWTTAADPQD